MMTPEAENSSEIPREVLQEILLKLSTRDVARSCCVSRLWRDSVKDPSFRSLHGKASHVTYGGAAETLLVSEKRMHDCNDEAGVFSVSSGRALGRVAIINGYVLANVCNGFLCFAHGNRGIGLEAPVLVCNPVTGETMKLPDAPPLASRNRMHLFALGFSPPSNEYKLFRLWFNSSVKSVDVDVYTLGDSAGEWRRLSYFSSCRPMEVWAPVFIDGKIYVATLPWKDDSRRHVATLPWNDDSSRHEIPERILVIDVSTEMCHTYHLPTRWTYPKPPVNAFELNGELCFAAVVRNNRRNHDALHFWVMSPPPPEDNDDYDMDGELCWAWDLCYSFNMEGRYSPGLPWASWLGDDEMLCYLQGSTLYKYDMRDEYEYDDDILQCDQQVDLPDQYDDDDLPDQYDDDDDLPDQYDDDDILQWDEQVDLPTTPLLPGSRWPNIYGGYRPTLLSPLTLQPQDDVNDENRYQHEHAMLSALHESKK